MGICGLYGFVSALPDIDRLLLETHATRQGSIRRFTGIRHAGNFLLARRHQRRHGLWVDAGGRSSLADGELWRISTRDDDVRDRRYDQRQHATVHLLKDWSAGVMG